MSVGVTVEIEGADQVETELASILERISNPKAAAAAFSIWAQGQTQRAVINEGNPSHSWPEMSPMTRFLRARRTSAPNRSPNLLRDTGRLMGAFAPISSEDGLTMGVSNNVEYAALMQFGGVSKDNVVEVSKKKGVKGGKAAPFFWHMGGQRVPARPFFPDGPAQVRSWGYYDKIVEIFRRFVHDGAA